MYERFCILRMPILGDFVDTAAPLHTQEMHLLVDDGIIAEAHGADRVLAIDDAALVSTQFVDHLHPNDRSVVTAAFESIADGSPRVTEVEYRFLPECDQHIWLRSRLVNDPISDLEGYLVSSVDITPRARASTVRQRVNDRFKQLAESTDDVVWMYTADWEQLLFINSAYESVWEQPLEQLKAKPTTFLDVVHPDDRERTMDAMGRLSAGVPIDIEFRIQPEPNRTRWAWAQGQPIFEDGTVSRVGGFVRDITRRRQRAHHLDVIDRVLRHNLRNDLNIMLGYAEIAAERDDETVVSAIDRIRNTGERLLETVEKQREIVDVLTRRTEQRRLDLVAIASAAIDTVCCEYDLSPFEVSGLDAAPVVAVPMIEEAIAELVRNAVTYAGANEPVVDIAVESADGSVIISIADRGPTIPEQEIAVLTEPSAHGPLYHGSGLGLWFVYCVVDLSGGSIEFSERDRGGNHITIRLSAAESIKN